MKLFRFLVICLLASLFPTVVSAVDKPIDLTGVVKSIEGRALPNASIFIYTAAPRVGAGYI